jgi:hypothetical protein
VTQPAERLAPAQRGDVFLHFHPFGGLVQATEWIRRFAGGSSP